jgi:hypothetical protein
LTISHYLILLFLPQLLTPSWVNLCIIYSKQRCTRAHDISSWLRTYMPYETTFFLLPSRPFNEKLNFLYFLVKLTSKDALHITAWHLLLPLSTLVFCSMVPKLWQNWTYGKLGSKRDFIW